MDVQVGGVHTYLEGRKGGSVGAAVHKHQNPRMVWTWELTTGRRLGPGVHRKGFHMRLAVVQSVDLSNLKIHPEDENGVAGQGDDLVDDGRVAVEHHPVAEWWVNNRIQEVP